MPEHKVFVGSLSYRATDDDIYACFEKYGKVLDAKVITDRDTGKSRGFAFVEFEKKEEAEDAIERANGEEIQGREITCSEAKARGEGGGRGGG